MFLPAPSAPSQGEREWLWAQALLAFRARQKLVFWGLVLQVGGLKIGAIDMGSKHLLLRQKLGVRCLLLIVRTVWYCASRDGFCGERVSASHTHFSVDIFLFDQCVRVAQPVSGFSFQRKLLHV